VGLIKEGERVAVLTDILATRTTWATWTSRLRARQMA